MTVEQCIISFLVALLILISSTYDVYSDGRLAQSFIVGAYYIYYSHSRVSTKYIHALVIMKNNLLKNLGFKR